jgi:hypothetical protein
MRDSNFLQDALNVAATEPLDTCTLCGVIINRPTRTPTTTSTTPTTSHSPPRPPAQPL